MPTPYVNPIDQSPLAQHGEWLVSPTGKRYPIINEVPRFCEADNYTANFGKQWNFFEKTQIDGEGIPEGVSERRLFAETGWDPKSLDGLAVLEAGSGAGRFSRVILQRTGAHLSSIDYSSAVEANWRNNAAIAPGRFHLAQASIYEMPFADASFDKVVCLGVLQHTPDFAKSITALVGKAKPGAEIVVDFYPIRGWWTKLHAKYLLRPFTRSMDHARLHGLLERNLYWMIALAKGLSRVGLHALTRFLPLVDLRTMAPGMSPAQEREAILLDTFDMMSPQYDDPQRIPTVVRMFERAGARVTFAGWVENGLGAAAVVRAIRN